jgi:drug/metabolite transporter (DMT)-like permease
MNRAPIFSCLFAAVLFGASTPASKALLGPLEPFVLAGLLYLGAAVAVFPWAVWGSFKNLKIDKRNLRLLGGAVLFGGILGPVLLLFGLAQASAASTALWLNLETVATALFARFLFKEHLDIRAWLAIALVLAASTLLASPSGFAGGSAAVLIALACVCWGIDNNLTALIDGITPAQSTFVKGLVAGTTNLVLGLLLGSQILHWSSTFGALAVGGLGYGLSIVLYIIGAQQLGATRSQMLFATAPFWGVAVSWIVLAETVTLTQIAAGVLMGFSLWLMHAERHGHTHVHSPTTHMHLHRHDDRHHDHFHRGLPGWMWHSHDHQHHPVHHTHSHQPDLHHRHDH